MNCANKWVSLSGFLPRIVFPLILWMCLTACGGGGSGPTLGGGFATGEVQPLEFGPDGQALLNFGDLGGGEEFALIFFAANINEGNFGIQLTSGSTASTHNDIRLLSNPTSYLPEIEQQEGDPTSNFHQWLREEEKTIGEIVNKTGTEKYFSSDSEGFNFFIENAWNSPCADGRGIYVKVLNTLNSNTNYDIVCALEKRVTENVIYYVDVESEGLLKDSILDEVIADFESKIPHERRLLGTESDVNGDGHFAVCFCSGVNRLGANSGGYVTGFFFGGDLFSQQGIPSSNEKEILFISVPDPSGQWGFPVPLDFWRSNIAKSVITHEFQHMISYRSKVLDHEVGAEDAWANEGLSHLMEDLVDNYASPLDHIGLENPSRVALFLASPQNAAFTNGTSLPQRGGAYLFFRYLYEQAELKRFPASDDGEDLLKNLLDSPLKGIPNIENATGWTFRNLLLDFYATLELSNTGLTDDPRYNFHGVNLFADQNDNRGTVLNGVQDQILSQVPVKGQVSSPGGIYYNINGNTLIQSGKSLTFLSDPGMIPGGAVIRLQ